MSQQIALSPSPVLFRDSGSSSFDSAWQERGRVSDHGSSSTHEQRRRTPRPHGSRVESLFVEPDDAPEQSRTPQLPRLPNRGSQTVIDLTQDLSDEPEIIAVNYAPRPASRLRRARSQSQSQRPPALQRSDTSNLADIIDLTSDAGDAEVQFQHSRELPPPPRVRENERLRSRRLPSVPQAPRRAEERSVGSLFVPRHPQHGPIARFAGYGALLIGHATYPLREFFGQGSLIMDGVQQVIGPMPDHLDYRNNAFEARKPEHVAPPPARENFTRSPTENDVIICPSCEEELVHDKDEEEPAAKKNGKPLSRREREEHPFWVVKECGHVYCNACFQQRLNSGKPSIKATFPTLNKVNNKGQKTIACAVDDCESDVRHKDKWVGVFL
ncbi:hypothetical protein F5884DRAFT_750277 [Xylogone sp. PMI_703]|nr:hypothetical protein F5884DRAFT_750277 [Xylogone sp. PMI_703]